jgi:Ca-activated chloride channel family protein
MIGFPEIYGWSLLDPWFLLGIPVLVLAAVVRRLWPRAALPAAQTALFAGLPRTLRSRLVHLPLWSSVLAGCVLVVALARPVRRELLPQREQGVDIVLVVDTSSSMSLEDMDEREPLRRVDAARTRALEFAAARVHDRVAFLAFARYAELRCPPTLDEQALAAFVSATDIVPEGSEFDGTAIGVAVAKAVRVLEHSTAQSRLVVLLSDGETTRNLPDTILPEDAAKLAKDAGIRIHAIGLGHGMPTFGGFVPLEFKDLKLLAAETGGRFFAARTDRALAEVYAEIDALEKTELEDPRYRTEDGFAWPLAAGLLLLGLSLLLEVFWIRGVP